MAQTSQISQRSTGTGGSATASPSDPGGVVVATPAKNSAARNPAGSGGAAIRKAPLAVPTPGGRNVASVAGRTVVGTNKTIGSGK
jgi:hypothetical protein